MAPPFAQLPFLDLGTQTVTLREGRVDRHRIDRSLIRHLDSYLISGELHPRLDLSPRRVERMQLVIAQPCSSSSAIQQDRLPSLPQSRLQISAQLQPQIQLLSGPSLSGDLRDREALLQPARTVHIPFADRAAVTRAPLVFDPVVPGFDIGGWRRLLPIPVTISGQLHS